MDLSKKIIDYQTQLDDLEDCNVSEIENKLANLRILCEQMGNSYGENQLREDLRKLVRIKLVSLSKQLRCKCAARCGREEQEWIKKLCELEKWINCGELIDDLRRMVNIGICFCDYNKLHLAVA